MLGLYNKTDNLIEKVDKNTVLKIFEEIGYSAKYKTKEKFYQITEINQGKIFYFHTSLLRGRVELIFGLKEDFNGEHLGGQISGVCKRIELNKGIHSDGYLRYSTFNSYDELKSILSLSLQLYEDLKEEILKLYL